MKLKVSGVDLGQIPPTFSAGILITGGASADILDSDVYGNDTPGSPTTTTATGIQFQTTGNGLLAGNRIYGGTAATTSATSGVKVVQGGMFEMDNCMVHGGEGQQGNAVTTSASTTVLHFDTIYENGVSAQGVGGVGGYAIKADSGSVTLQNLLILNASPNAIALSENNCPNEVGGTSGPGTFDAMDHIVFGDFAWSDYCQLDSFNCGGANQTLKYDALTTVDGNSSHLLFLSSSKCPGSCATSLFGASWGNDDGLTALFSTTQADAGVAQKGWTFATPPPCSIATGGTLVTGVTTDINGTSRSSLPSIGATEVVGPCTP
jgi:hypothetical protein